MQTVDPGKMFYGATDTKMFRKKSNTTSTITTHGRFSTIGIEVTHFKLFGRIILKNHQPIGTHTHTTVAKKCDPFSGGVKLAGTSVNHNKIITSALIFVKMEFHLSIHSVRLLCKYGKISPKPFWL